MAKRPAFLQRDPPAHTVRTGWLIWGLWTLVAGTLWLNDAGAGRGAISALLVAPFWALWLLWPAYRTARAVLRWRTDSIWADWQGQYFEFDGHQVRIRFDNGAVWFDAHDVFDAVGIEGHQRDADRVRQIAGRDGLQVPEGGNRLAFSEAGLSAWLERRSDPAALKFARWVQKQVLEPYQRRREMHGDG